MPILELTARQFRNLRSFHIEAAPGVNIFFGENGSGKTSILEAIHYLGLGKSFRTHVFQRIIQYKTDHFLIHAHAVEDQERHSIGLMRSQQGRREIKINGESVAKLSDLAKQLPLQLISVDSHRYFHESRNERREFLDWGLFYTEPTFLSLWQKTQSVLKQRNAALKFRCSLKEITVWDLGLIEFSNNIHQLRYEYFIKLRPIVEKMLADLLDTYQLDLRYFRGWDEKKTFEEVLNHQIKEDMQLGYTKFGAHRADLQLYVDNIPVQDVLSQGQQKLAAYALRLSQGVLMKQETGRSPIYLIDELPADLDIRKRECLATTLQALNSQVFVTGITVEELRALFDISSKRVFHVKHGEVLSVMD